MRSNNALNCFFCGQSIASLLCFVQEIVKNQSHGYKVEDGKLECVTHSIKAKIVFCRENILMVKKREGMKVA